MWQMLKNFGRVGQIGAAAAAAAAASALAAVASTQCTPPQIKGECSITNVKLDIFYFDAWHVLF